MTRLLVVAALALLGLAAVAGCGGGDASSDGNGDQGGGGVMVSAPSGSSGGGQHSGSLGDLDSEQIYGQESPGVVTVISLFGGGGQAVEGLGSGFVVSDDGEIATNAHVVTNGEGGALRRADQVFVQFGDLNEVAAKIRGVDPNADVALLRIDPSDLETDLRPLPLGRVADVDVGEPVAAIGSPFGEPQSLSVGVVSALNRSIQSLTGFAIAGAIQTDAAINSGNSGGPLLDGEGRVIGINSQIKSATGSGSGVGFAVNSDTVKHSLDALRTQGEVRYAYLGVSTVPVYPQLAERFGLGVNEGAWVQTVDPGGPADDAGIRGGHGPPVRFQAQSYRVGGDVIVALGGQSVRRSNDVAQLLERYQPGDVVDVRLQRGDQQLTVQVKLGERPAASGP